MNKSLYLKCEPSDVGELVLLTGSPERIDRVAARLDAPQTVAQNREFYTVTGRYKGQTISGRFVGYWSPLSGHRCGRVKTVRGQGYCSGWGTMMGVKAPMGCCVIATGAARFEGTSKSYLDMAYPAVPDWTLAQQLLTSGQSNGLDVQLGITATYDGFYPHIGPYVNRTRSA